jgi:hypothetical protein
MQELTSKTDFETVLTLSKIKVYRSSANMNKQSYRVGSHVGTKQQALIRADYMVNDEGTYYRYYLYELNIDLGKIWPMLEPDDGINHDDGYFSEIAEKFDTVIYKNTGEGDIKNNNLSIVILNPKNITSSKMVKQLNCNYLSSIQDELYG